MLRCLRIYLQTCIPTHMQSNAKQIHSERLHMSAYSKGHQYMNMTICTNACIDPCNNRGESSGFKVGPSTDPETMGVWLLMTEQRASDGSRVVLVDTEGFYGESTARAYSRRKSYACDDEHYMRTCPHVNMLMCCRVSLSIHMRGSKVADTGKIGSNSAYIRKQTQINQTRESQTDRQINANTYVRTTGPLLFTFCVHPCNYVSCRVRSLGSL